MFDLTQHRQFNSLLQSDPSSSGFSFNNDYLASVSNNLSTVIFNLLQLIVELGAQIIITSIEVSIICINHVAIILTPFIEKIISLNLDYKDWFYCYFMVAMTIMMSALMSYNIKMSSRLIEYQELNRKFKYMENDVKNLLVNSNINNANDRTSSESENSSDSSNETRRYSRRQRRPPLRYPF